MGIEIYPVLENKDCFYFCGAVEWKTLAKCMEFLDSRAAFLNIPPLGEFVTISRHESGMEEEEMQEMEQEAELRDGVWYLAGLILWTVETKWFEPEAALPTVNGLLQHIRAHPNTIESDDEAGVLWNLEELKKVLMQAQQENTRFKLFPSG